MTILEQVSGVITAYKRNYKTLSIDDLLNCKDKLVTLNYNLAEETADSKDSYNMGYFLRKINVTKAKNAYIYQGKSAAAAESAAIENTRAELKDELLKESNAYRLDLLLKQSNKVVDAIQQRVSFLKTEKQNADYGQNT